MMQDWFLDAKLGIFIHYGIYAVKGIDESWAFFNGKISHADYMKQLDGFTASKYDPEAWADLFERAGAMYAVLTTKHHDGVALWDTQVSDLSTVRATPAKRDLITPYCEALRRHNLRVGFYFSQLDWSHPDYATVRPERHKDDPDDQLNPFAYPRKGEESPERWENYLEFHRAQIRELCTQFGKVDLLWFDGDWERDERQFKMRELRDAIHAMQPEVVINSRMLGYGDYATPEQGQPVVAPEGPWEFCVTVNDSWGYQVQDRNHKSTRQIVRMCAECFGLGGNVLLDVGPYEDGTLQPEQVDRLEGLGRWMKKHASAIYGTRAGIPAGLFYGPTTASKDGKELNLFFFERPIDQVVVRGVRGKVSRATVVGSGRELTQRRIGSAEWCEIPGNLYIDFPADEVDPDCTVVKLEFEEPFTTSLSPGRS
jgi:alpha-L-fucosidase